jgi:hypothetical protein
MILIEPEFDSAAERFVIPLGITVALEKFGRAWIKEHAV